MIIEKLLTDKHKKPLKLDGSIVFIGMAQAGKSSILNRLKYDQFIVTKPTLAINVDQFSYRNIIFTAFDMGGQQNFQELWDTYVRSAVAVCFVIDAYDKEHYNESCNALLRILDKIPENAILLLLANKSDIAGENVLPQLLKDFNIVEIQMKAKLNAVNFFFVSAKTGEQIYEAFDWLIDRLLYMQDPSFSPITVSHVWIFESDSGRNIGQLHLGSTISMDDYVIAPFFSAMTTFTKNSFTKDSDLGSIVIKRPEGNLKLVRAVDKNVAVVLAVDEKDSKDTIRKVFKEMIAQVNSAVDINDHKLIKPEKLLEWLQQCEVLLPHKRNSEIEN